MHCGLLNTISLKNSSALCNFYCSHVNVISGYVLLLIYNFNLELGLAVADPRVGGGGSQYAQIRAQDFLKCVMRYPGEKIGQMLAFRANLWCWHPSVKSWISQLVSLQLISEWRHGISIDHH